MLNKSQRQKVMHFDDERDIGNSIIVTLNYGWCFEEMGPEHVQGFDTIREAKQGINEAIRCQCKDCMNHQ